MMVRTATKIVAEICLYGTHQHGTGWLASVPPLAERDPATRPLGDGELNARRSFTESVWQACDAIQKAGVEHGTVRVFDSGGQRMADVNLNRPGYFGDLKWVSATVITIPMEAILEAAATQAAEEAEQAELAELALARLADDGCPLVD